jgi:STE24 endopeptidase
MKTLLFIVLTVFLCWEAVGIILTILNLRYLEAHGDKVPVGFEEKVDTVILARMRQYTVDCSRVEIVSTIFGIMVSLWFLFGPGLEIYNSWLTGLGYGSIVSGVLFFLLLSYAHTLIKIPFSLYSTFVIEKRYGFNQQTFSLWLADTAKGLALGTVLNILLLSAAFWLINRFPQSWWLLTWTFFLVFSIFMMYLAPYVIEPLFNKFTPVNDQEFEAQIKDLMGKAGISISKVLTMDASKRSRHSNAYFSGIGHVKRIVLFDTLLDKNSREETLAILAHEAGHWRKKHIVKRLVAMETLALVGIYLFYLLVQTDFLPELFSISKPTMAVKLLLAGFVGSLVAFPLQPLSNYISRRHEREADDFAVELTGQPVILAKALIKLSRDNLANLYPHPLYASFYYSHPPLVERVRRLKGAS